ncbi:hypothetical protein [Aeromonas caviae]|uniref:hypothetical protein n=1 Tax=Aeromonas caviae TaxID=648 RepID=UPI00227F83C2|nr:hypothetical protein [Aeromonas caviae]MCY9815734.1 hypothetical protein [Aeromonas caviae]
MEDVQALRPHDCLGMLNHKSSKGNLPTAIRAFLMDNKGTSSPLVNCGITLGFMLFRFCFPYLPVNSLVVTVWKMEAL